MKQLSFIFLFSCFVSAQAQSAFQENNSAITIGYGVPNIYRRLVKQDMESKDAGIKSIARQFGSTFTYSNSGFGPVFLKYDYGVSDKIGLGLTIGYFNAGVTETYAYRRTVGTEQRDFYQAITRHTKSFSAGLRFNYHFGEKRRLDPYIGLAAGYTHAVTIESFGSNDPSVHQVADEELDPSSPFYLAATIGLRDYITEHFGAYIELGFDKWTLLQGGICLKVP